jgi:hypothetical protein
VELDAVKAAVELLHMPTKAGWYRSAPLPNGMTSILAIAAGDTLALDAAAAATGRPHATLVSASSFFIEQVLLHSANDSFRTLGGTADTELALLRRNMAHLLRWLHPDHTPDGDRAVFATRVTAAWETIKTPDRRIAYAARQAASLSGTPTRKTKSSTSDARRPTAKPNASSKGMTASAAAIVSRASNHVARQPAPTLFRRALAKLGLGTRGER